ncbi:MAG TPA: tetratricopeptide repeat protein, partial [Methylomirabilota bacterium]|nr:tetratricopeptide repeat protein [Methylomirabilota bacterium]
MPKRPFRTVHVLAITAFLLSTGCASHERPRAVPESAAPPPETGARASAPQKAASRQQESRRNVEAGNELMKRGQYDEAERSFRLALEADPGSLEAVAGLGRVAVQRGQYSEAVPLLERATRVSSQIVSAFQALGD